MLMARRSVRDRRTLDQGEAGIGHAAVVGAIIGYFAVVAVVGSIVLVAGAGFGTALGVGAFVGLWGGPGWGGMAAAQRYADRLDEEERKARSTSPASDRAAA